MEPAAETPDTGGNGGDLYAREDLQRMERLLRRARHTGPRFVLEEWMRKDVPAEIALIATSSEHERNRIAAARVLAAFDALNMQQERNEEAIVIPPPPPQTPAVNVNVQVNNYDHLARIKQLEALYDELVAQQGIVSGPPGIERPQQSLDPPHTNGTAKLLP